MLIVFPSQVDCFEHVFFSFHFMIVFVQEVDKNLL